MTLSAGNLGNVPDIRLLDAITPSRMVNYYQTISQIDDNNAIFAQVTSRLKSCRPYSMSLRSSTPVFGIIMFTLLICVLLPVNSSVVVWLYLCISIQMNPITIPTHYYYRVSALPRILLTFQRPKRDFSTLCYNGAPFV